MGQEMVGSFFFLFLTFLFFFGLLHLFYPLFYPGGVLFLWEGFELCAILAIGRAVRMESIWERTNGRRKERVVGGRSIGARKLSFLFLSNFCSWDFLIVGFYYFRD